MLSLQNRHRAPPFPLLCSSAPPPVASFLRAAAASLLAAAPATQHAMMVLTLGGPLPSPSPCALLLLSPLLPRVSLHRLGEHRTTDRRRYCLQRWSLDSSPPVSCSPPTLDMTPYLHTLLQTTTQVH
mmetsp:Transcript_17602/g.53656  ORF Transcript_17602/g.53656 Transcript_17602/m.53656 type:complete len:127 (-) Transcript_17602:849-1229(-)